VATKRRKRQHAFTARNGFGRKEIDRIVKMVERYNLHGIQLQSKFSLVFVTPVLGSRDKVGFLKRLAGQKAKTGKDKQGQTYVDGGWRLTYMSAPSRDRRDSEGNLSSGGVGGEVTTAARSRVGGHNNFKTLRDALRSYAKRILHGDEEVTVGLHEARALRESAGDARGDCYEAAANYVLNNSGVAPLLLSPGVTPNPGLILVHGEVTGQGVIEGVKYGHAWVEDGDMVIDVSNGRNLRLPKDAYYALGRVNHDGVSTFKPNLHRYTAAEVRRNLVKHGVWGPWDLKTSSGL
jgi:hypothetical protein